MNGIIIINKEKGMTSHDVVNKARRIFKTKRVGHLGTLDPNATGVLVLCLNEATKLVPFLENDSKKYLAEVILGVSTNTDDITGKVLEEKAVNITKDELFKTLEHFHGKMKSVPPIYSAIKVNGKKLYEYARKEQDVEIKPRDIEIFDLIWDGNWQVEEGRIYFYIETTVSKGTYIRSICRDIGKLLKIPSTMGNLTRLASGKFKLRDATSLKDVENGDYKVISMTDVLNMDVIKLNESNLEFVKKISNGMKISFDKISEFVENIPLQVAFSYQDNLLAIYEKNLDDNCYKVERVWKLLN